MDDRSDLISKLKNEFETRAAYIKAKVGTLVPSQIRALRLKSEMPRQADLANAADMKQSRISMMETPGAANMTLDTLSSIAAALKVGLKVEFVPFSEMLAWENDFSQDHFDVTKIDNDLQFINPPLTQIPEYIQPAVNTWWITMDLLKALTGGYSHNTGGKLRIIADPSATRKVFVRAYNLIEANDLSASTLPDPQTEFGDVPPWMLGKMAQSETDEPKN